MNNIVLVVALKLQLFIKKARFKVRPSYHVSIVTCHRRSLELPRLRSLHLCGPFHVLDLSYVRSIPLTSQFTRFPVGIPAAYSVGLPAAVSIQSFPSSAVRFLCTPLLNVEILWIECISLVLTGARSAIGPAWRN